MAQKFSILDRIKSFKFAFKGLWHVFKNEHNFWVHLFATAFVIGLGFYFEVSQQEWLWLIFAIGLVLSAEVFNSAIESLVDLVSPEFQTKAGQVKDMAAAAVLVASITAAIVGFIVFYPYLKI